MKTTVVTVFTAISAFSARVEIVEASWAPEHARARVYVRVRVYFPVFMYVCVCMCKRVPEAAFKPKWNAELRNMTPLRPVKLKL